MEILLWYVKKWMCIVVLICQEVYEIYARITFQFEFWTERQVRFKIVVEKNNQSAKGHSY
jgi:hypothetical protein